MKRSGLMFVTMLLPLMTGATSYVEEEHKFYLGDQELVNEKNAEKISNELGYFGEFEFPTLFSKNIENCNLELKFYPKTSMKYQIRVVYAYGSGARFKIGEAGCTYYTLYQSDFRSTEIGKARSFKIPLKGAYGNYGISTDERDDIYTNNFYIGFYVDEHINNYTGKYYYMKFPTTYCTGDIYNMQVGHYATNYYCHPSILVAQLYKYEYHKRVFLGGKEWKNEMECVRDGRFVDWQDFQKENRGEITKSYFSVPLKMELRDYAHQPTSITVKEGDANLFIYDGYENYNLGEPTTGFTGEKGYKIPLRVLFDGRYITLKPKVAFYLSPDYRKVYFKETIPNGVNSRNYVTLRNYIPIPAISGSSPVTFKYQVELLNAGPLGLVNILAAFSYTKSKNYFGSHADSAYYVEEVL